MDNREENIIQEENAVQEEQYERTENRSEDSSGAADPVSFDDRASAAPDGAEESEQPFGMGEGDGPGWNGQGNPNGWQSGGPGWNGQGNPNGWQSGGPGWNGQGDPSGWQNRNGDPYQGAAPYQNGGSGYFSQDFRQNGPFRPDSFRDEPEEPIKVSEWLITLLVLSIPCLNLVMLFVWGFSKSEKRSKSNYCKASLIWMAICCGICVLLYIVILAGIIAGLG